MTDERNFRSSYYEKVGCRGVEEKKSLEILLKERPWDKVKLKQFCLRFTVPAAYRALVWKVLLGILPPYPDSHSFVAEQRAAQHADLAHALAAMALAEDEPPARRLLAMWQLERGVRTTPRLVEDSYVNIAEVCLRVLVDEVDAYWVSKALCTLAIPAANRDLPVLQELVFNILLKEEPLLHAHLIAVGALHTLPLQQWFACCFAGILDDSSLLKIWDKVVCGANKLLAFVAVVVVCGARRALLAAATAPLALRALHQRPEQCEEVIAAKAIDLWHYYGALPPPPPPPPAATPAAATMAPTPAPAPAPAPALQ